MNKFTSGLPTSLLSRCHARAGGPKPSHAPGGGFSQGKSSDSIGSAVDSGEGKEFAVRDRSSSTEWATVQLRFGDSIAQIDGEIYYKIFGPTDNVTVEDMLFVARKYPKSIRFVDRVSELEQSPFDFAQTGKALPVSVIEKSEALDLYVEVDLYLNTAMATAADPSVITWLFAPIVDPCSSLIDAIRMIWYKPYTDATKNLTWYGKTVGVNHLKNCGFHAKQKIKVQKVIVDTILNRFVSQNWSKSTYYKVAKFMQDEKMDLDFDSTRLTAIYCSQQLQLASVALSDYIGDNNVKTLF